MLIDYEYSATTIYAPVTVFLYSGNTSTTPVNKTLLQSNEIGVINRFNGLVSGGTYIIEVYDSRGGMATDTFVATL